MSAKTIEMEYDKILNNLEDRIKKYPWEDKAAYTNWLAQSYFFVRHSTRLLGVASGATPLGNDKLHIRMAKHISEEFAHDKIAVRDLEKLDCKIDDFTELDETKLFYRNQYYGIQNFGPYFLMGYILFLEGLAVMKGPEIHRRTKDKFGADATKFVSVHVEEDDDHIKKAFEQVADLNQKDETLLIESMRTSGKLYCYIMDGLMAQYESSKKQSHKVA